MSDRPSGFVIAVVDDDPRILRALAALLESASYTVRPFESATAMLQSGCVSEIDCLISDIGMPVMDGFELVRTVRAERPRLPIILISGRSDALPRLASSEYSHYQLFTKPFDGSDLLAAVGSALPTDYLPPARL